MSSGSRQRAARCNSFDYRMGDNALARFERDVLSHTHADTVVLMMGTLAPADRDSNGSTVVA